MMRRFLAAIGLAASLSAPLPAEAQVSIDAFEAVHSALLAVWEELPLTVRNVTLTTQNATGYGDYTPYEGKRVEIGQTIHVYVEVLGYGWKDNGDGTLSELLEADLNLVDASGAVVASQAKFLTADIRSRHRLLETYLTLEATLTDFAAGEYILRYVLHDAAAGKQTEFDVPVTLVAP